MAHRHGRKMVACEVHYRLAKMIPDQMKIADEVRVSRADGGRQPSLRYEGPAILLTEMRNA
jgi:hypothetical protein